MSGRGLEFVYSWVVYLNHTKANPLAASRTATRAECVEAAELEGISASEIEEEVGDIPDFLFNEMSKEESSVPQRNLLIQLKDDQQRQLKRKHKGVALLRALGATLAYGILLYFVAGLHVSSFGELTSSNNLFFLVVLVGTFWGQYRWLNYKAGIGPEAPDPNLNDGP